MDVDDMLNQGQSRIELAPGWVTPVRAAGKARASAAAGVTVPKAPRFFANGVSYVADEAGAGRVLDFARQRGLSHVGFDTEFRYDRPGVVIDRKHTAHDPRSVRPLLLSLALAEPGEGGAGALYLFVVDLRRPAVLPALAELLRLPVPFVAHFARAELFCLWQLGLPEPRILWDTWVHEKAVHLGLHHKRYGAGRVADEAEEAQARELAEDDQEFSLALPATCLRHGVPHPFATEKGRLQRSFLEHADGEPFSDEQVAYAAADAEAAACLYLPQVLEAGREGLLQHLTALEMPWVITTARMGWRGVRVDQEKCRAVNAACERHLAALRPRLEQFGVGNVRSHKQLSEFFARLGLLELFRREGKITFDKEQLEAVQDRHPAIPLIRAARRILDLQKEKVLSGELVGADGRVHPDYRQLGTHTGRQSSRWPNVMGLGRIFRPLVVAAPGRGIGEVDYSQIEVGVAAAVYGDDRLVEMFNSDDVYSAMAKDFFRSQLSAEDLGLPGPDFKKRHRTLRDLVKTCTLGIIYGLTPHGLALRLKKTEAEAAALQEQFMAMFPALRKSLAETPRYGAVCGFVSTVSGLRRHRAWRGPLSTWERNWMVNHPVQGSAADVFKSAGNRLDRLYQRYDAWLVVPVHDAFVFEAPLAALGALAELTERVMLEAVEEYFPQLRPKAERNVQEPGCWNKDAHADSLDRWMEEPTCSF